jgi:drug/metabolite transporter (DMT)-like permease
MRIVAGAVLCLAGTVVYSAATVADAILSAAGRTEQPVSNFGLLVGGGLLALIGILVFLAGLMDYRHGRRPGSEGGLIHGAAPYIPGMAGRPRTGAAEPARAQGHR